jgi:hypothetical protein
MAVPAPTIPSGNAYAVNVASASEGREALADFTRAAAPLLRPWKIPVKMHVAGDSPALTALRESVVKAGARVSGFSPAPSPDVPGEGCWKTTIVVVEALGDAENFWTGEREDKKVGWDPLVIALRSGSVAGLPSSALSAADLWVVNTENATDENPVSVREAWMNAGAGAVAVTAPGEIAWASRNAVFGNSSGTVTADSNGSEAKAGAVAARIVASLLRDLLGENLFDKTLVRADRECLEMRPLRLGRACGAPFIPAKTWGSLGRKERHESHA